MPIITTPADFNVDDLFVDLRELLGAPVYLKCEGFNFAGSVKLKAAAAMIAAAERDGTLRPGAVLIESSSGNLGVALSIIAANKGYEFLCVTDSRCNPATLRLMRSLGARVHVITEPDPVGGYLGARLAQVRRLAGSDPRYVWLDQYRNDGNWMAHHQLTAPAIAKEFPHLGVLFVGAGTAGTLMGCARYFREFAPAVRIVAVDAVGSVTFAPHARPVPRRIPGLGMGIRPPLLEESHVDDVVLVDEPTTIACCHRLAAHGFLFGGSTGTVVAGALRWLAEHPRALSDGAVAVAIAPDLGERYLDTVYSPQWAVSSDDPDGPAAEC